MSAQISDLFNEPTTTTRPDAAALTAQKLIGAASITVDTTAGWPTATAVHFVIYQVTAAGVRVEGTQTEWKGIVTSATALGTLTLQAGTDQVYPIGSKVICTPTAAWGDDLVEGLLTSLDQDGTLKAGAVDASAVIADGVVSDSKPIAGYGLVPTGSILPYVGRTAPTNWLMCFGGGISRTTYAELFSVIVPTVGTFTTTIAAPGVVTLASHAMVTGDQVYLTTTGALPTGLTANTLYYVVYVDANTFNLATSRANAVAGTKITTSGSQSGVHTLKYCPYGLGDGSTTFNVPDARGRVLAGADAMGGTAATRLTLSKAEGSYGQVGASGGAQAHTLITAELAAHTHAFAVNSAPAANATTPVGSTSGLWGNGATASAGSDSPHNNVQPTLVTNYMIRI